MGFHRGFLGKSAVEADAPVWTSVTAGNGNITLSWAAPYAAGYNITGYQVQHSTDNTTWNTPGSIVYSGASAIVSSLSIGSAYYFRVRAIVGGSLAGKWAATQNTTVFGTAPGQVGTPSVSAYNGYITVDWADGTTTNGYAINDYVLQYSSNSGSTWSDYADGTSSVTETNVSSGLSYGTSYVFRVAAVNQVGQGAWSSASAAALYAAAPATPGSVSTSVGDRSFTLSWAAPANNGSSITEYVVFYYRPYVGSWESGTTSGTSFSITSRNGQQVQAYVYANNARGSSGNSALSYDTPVFPGQPAPTVSASNGVESAPGIRGVLVTYDPVDCSEFNSCQIQSSTDNANWTVRHTATTNGSNVQTIGGFSINQTVYVRLVTINNDGDYTVSSTSSVVTTDWAESVTRTTGFSGTQTVSSNSYANNFDGTFTAGSNRKVLSVTVGATGTDTPAVNDVFGVQRRQVSAGVATFYSSDAGASTWLTTGTSIFLSSVGGGISNGTYTILSVGTSTTYGHIFRITTSAANSAFTTISGSVTRSSYNTNVQSASRNFDLALAYQSDNSILDNIECGIAALGYNVSGSGEFTSARSVTDDYGRATRRIRIIGNGSLGGTWPKDERIVVRINVSYKDRW